MNLLRALVTVSGFTLVSRILGYARDFVIARSEERRVGKECRSRCDWSSDVCSSDLKGRVVYHELAPRPGYRKRIYPGKPHPRLRPGLRHRQIGRASCRERV